MHLLVNSEVILPNARCNDENTSKLLIDAFHTCCKLHSVSATVGTSFVFLQKGVSVCNLRLLRSNTACLTFEVNVCTSDVIKLVSIRYALRYTVEKYLMCWLGEDLHHQTEDIALVPATGNCRILSSRIEKFVC